MIHVSLELPLSAEQRVGTEDYLHLVLTLQLFQAVSIQNLATYVTTRFKDLSSVNSQTSLLPRHLNLHLQGNDWPMIGV